MWNQRMVVTFTTLAFSTSVGRDIAAEKERAW